MKLTKLSKKIIAIVSAFAMVVAGIAYSPETTYAASATVDGYTYTVENGPGTSWTGIVVQGIFDNQRIHFAYCCKCKRSEHHICWRNQC